MVRVTLVALVVEEEVDIGETATRLIVQSPVVRRLRRSFMIVAFLPCSFSLFFSDVFLNSDFEELIDDLVTENPSFLSSDDFVRVSNSSILPSYLLFAVLYRRSQSIHQHPQPTNPSQSNHTPPLLQNFF